MDAVTTLPRSRPLTRADLESMPDDGHRYELLDGALVVTPAPSPRHQIAVGELFMLLRQACPEDLYVFVAPLDVAIADDTVLRPDLLVARRSDISPHDLPHAPLLAVEVVSPSTRRIDLTLKRSRYEAGGCPCYWVLDPEKPSLTVWELRGEEYVEMAHVEGDQEYAVQTPYPITICPARLLS